jgi:hypothetical protein
VQLVPVVLWPAIDLAKHTEEIRADLGRQAATALASDTPIAECDGDFRDAAAEASRLASSIDEANSI